MPRRIPQRLLRSIKYLFPASRRANKTSMLGNSGNDVHQSTQLTPIRGLRHIEQTFEQPAYVLRLEAAPAQNRYYLRTAPCDNHQPEPRTCTKAREVARRLRDGEVRQRQAGKR